MSAAAPNAAPIDPTALILLFARGVIATLDLWPALTIAVREQWGGRDSADKKVWIASTIIDDFESRLAADLSGEDVMDQDDLADLLVQIMSDEFDANVEDGSIDAVAADVTKLWKVLMQDMQQGEGVVKEMEERAAKVQRTQHVQATKGQGTEGMSSDEEDDSEDDSDDGMDVDEAPQLVPVEEKERVEKVVDEDGFELVQKKGRR